MSEANFILNGKSIRITIQELKQGAIHRFYNIENVLDFHYDHENQNYAIHINAHRLSEPTMIYARKKANELIKQYNLKNHDKL